MRLPSAPVKQLRTLLIKPIGAFCNLRCEYCFYLDKQQLYPGPASGHRMDEAILDKLIRDMFACSDAPAFVWQGGEPTILGLPFFEHVVERQRVYARGRPYTNALQTHGALLDDAWADFLRREDFLVGISLDGPEHVNDYYRKDTRGQGTFQPVFTNAQRLLDKQVAVNVLATVNAYSVKYPEEIYDFFTQHGLVFMQFSPVVETDPRDPARAAPYSVDARDYGRFLDKLFKRWWRDFDFDHLKQKTSIRFFDSVFQRYAGMVPDHCAMHKYCNDYLVTEYNGDLFSCDFLVADETRVGNLQQISLHDAFYSEAHQAFGRCKAAYGEECRRCQWLELCHGGCIKDRVRDPHDAGHNRFCESYKYFFKRADSDFKKLARLYRKHY